MQLRCGRFSDLTTAERNHKIDLIRFCCSLIWSSPHRPENSQKPRCHSFMDLSDDTTRDILRLRLQYSGILNIQSLENHMSRHTTLQTEKPLSILQESDSKILTEKTAPLVLNIYDTNIPASGFFRLPVLQIVCISTSVASRSIYAQQDVRLPPIDRPAATSCINSDGPV